MHEATIAQSILDIAVNRFNQMPEAIAVQSIKVQLGEFRNVDLDSLQFAFNSLKTSFKGCSASELKAEIGVAVAICQNCHQQYHPGIDLAFRCDKCGGGIDKLVSGEELNIIGITLELADAEKN